MINAKSFVGLFVSGKRDIRVTLLSRIALRASDLPAAWGTVSTDPAGAAEVFNDLPSSSPFLDEQENAVIPARKIIISICVLIVMFAGKEKKTMPEANNN
jgi:hypothetical protein